MKNILYRVVKYLFVILVQVVIIIGSFISALSLHNDVAILSDPFGLLLLFLVPLVLIKLASFTLMHLLSTWWRFVSLYDLIPMLKANLLGSLLFAGYCHYSVLEFIHVPSAIFINDFLICFLLMSGARVAVRIAHEYSNSADNRTRHNAERVLIVGAGAAGQSIAREIKQAPNQNRMVIGYVDQDANRVNEIFEGVPVLATIDRLHDLLNSKRINLVILANPALCHRELRNIVMLCQECGVKSKVLPNVDAILNGNVSIRHTRDVKLDDLLGRPQVNLDVDRIYDYLAGKSVLVTGAAGSIGSEVCRQIAKFKVSKVILFDNAETPLFNVENELARSFPNVEFTPLLCDAKNNWQVDYALRTYLPDVVFHAAAYKHVPMSESNPLPALENNVLGTRNLVNAADRYNVKHFVMISTDKAVNPTNVMGASKRAAESYAQAVARLSQTRFVTVRFGNVLGSNGSVIPIFQEQILNGGPVTVTDRRMTRFFMTIPEAVQLVMQAGSMGKGGEIFVLNMGEQISILHIAEELIRLSGLTPYEDIDIVFTGLRPGEKLHEELLHTYEDASETSHEKIFIARSICCDLDKIITGMDQLSAACHAMNQTQSLKIIHSLVPEYTPELTIEKVPPAILAKRIKYIKSKILKYPIEVLEST